MSEPGEFVLVRRDLEQRVTQLAFTVQCILDKVTRVERGLTTLLDLVDESGYGRSRLEYRRHQERDAVRLFLEAWQAQDVPSPEPERALDPPKNPQGL